MDFRPSGGPTPVQNLYKDRFARVWEVGYDGNSTNFDSGGHQKHHQKNISDKNHKKSWFRAIKKVVMLYVTKYKAQGTNLRHRKNSHKSCNILNFGNLGCLSLEIPASVLDTFPSKISSKSIRFSHQIWIFRKIHNVPPSATFCLQNIFW